MNRPVLVMGVLALLTGVLVAGCGTFDGQMCTNGSHNNKGGHCGNGNSGGDTGGPDNPLPSDSPTPTSYLYDFDSGAFPAEMTSGGNAPWLLDGTTYSDPPFSARSGAIVDNQVSCLILQPPIATSSVNFYLAVDSEAGSDVLAFSINNVVVDQWSGEQGWTYLGFTHTLATVSYSWCYTKDATGAAGLDGARLDGILVAQ